MQVLINLVNNAVKYTPAGSNIRITAIPRDNMAEICVSDNGPGIPDELKERVFEMFFTGGNPIGDSRRSLGLGFTLCQAIIHLLPFYMIGYGVIRCFVEGLRTDSLYLMPGVRVSQVLFGCLILLGVLLVGIIRRRQDIQV